MPPRHFTVWAGEVNVNSVTSYTMFNHKSVCLAFAQLLAIASSIVRLCYRHRRGLLWWDDVVLCLSWLLALPVFIESLVILVHGETLFRASRQTCLILY